MPRARHRRRTSLITYGAAAAVLATVAAYGTIAIASPSGGTGAQATDTHALQNDFADAAREFGVPQNVLMAVSYRQTLWNAHGGKPSTTGNYNVMGLTQVDPGDVAGQSGAEVTDELNQSGDPARTRRFHPDAALLKNVGAVDTSDPRLHTLDSAAKLIGQSAGRLRTDSRQSVRGAAALLARYERTAVGSLPADAGHWYPAVARYSQSPDRQGAQLFADRVFDTVRSGRSATTEDGQQVSLPASPGVVPVKLSKTPLAAAVTTAPAVRADAVPAATPTPECPASLHCTFEPAAFAQNGSDKADYGNYDVTDRPADGQKITTIVIHDTEGSYAGSIASFQDPTAYSSTHYIIRASDGLVTQMIPTKDTAWHAGNKSVNMHSIGVEHEGYAIKSGSWYSEPQYESSAQLVRYLSALYGIPRDREHIIGHDDVPGPLDSYVGGMHWDPGPYWDWNHYMSLLLAPDGAGGAGAPLRTGQVIRVVPPYTTANQPAITYGGVAQAAHPANFVYLYSSPATSAAPLGDPYLHGGTAGTTDGPDWGDKAVAGGTFVVAQMSGDWTAIWYGGQKGWFYNPGGQYSSVVGTGPSTVVTPAAGRTTVPVYGRAYPESAAYAGTQVPVQTDNDKALTKYAIAAGQAYVPAGPAVSGDYFLAQNFDNSAPGDHTLVTGTTQFYPIRFNHRLAYVKAADVAQLDSTAPLAPASRYDVLARDSAGTLWQYQGSSNPSKPFQTRYKVGSGWTVYNAATALSPLRADGTGDVVARDSAGTLWYYKGTGDINAPLASRVKISTGWSAYSQITGVGDITGDGRPDLIARDSKGNLWLFKGTGTSTVLAARTSIGSGWNSYNLISGLADVTGDGKADLIARDTGGVLWLFKGTGSATAPFSARAKLGGGSAYNAVLGTGDLNTDAKADMLTRDTDGKLWLFKGTGNAASPFAAKVQVGTGWGMYGMLV
ncbi:N-acetylmuramoyl-L-alanine amidase [Actinacidiphila sp. ITFR-21]|uniref:N-acetylmuramoyl-L-alanine amidase n=1 Tax=Actinacidiphila sp. ITFR-21 TaxID=3075199 RepID=UPI00288C4EC9|nr:N-acetylmuramoyl-L-alanine amidase [Streptomyces sp. ITFR-21]WNI15151.1 N-acetylmuramoyl-L-alanine amidase [Streptomyces sp. ITFR-21]